MTLRGALASRHRRDRTVVIGNDINADIERLADLDEASRHRIELLMGHMSFGLHTLLAPGARYVTIVRDPVERVLSEYRFLRSNTRHPFHARVKEMSLAEYLESGFTGQAANGQTRLLCGSHVPGSPGIAGREPLGDEDVSRALANIDRYFVLAGTQERFEESLMLMARRLGWRSWPFFVVRNVTRAGERGETFSLQDHERVASANHLDIALYRAVNAGVERAIADAGPGFAASLERFVRLNGIYQRLHWRRVQYGRRLRRAAGRLVGDRSPPSS